MLRETRSRPGTPREADLGIQPGWAFAAVTLLVLALMLFADTGCQSVAAWDEQQLAAGLGEGAVATGAAEPGGELDAHETTGRIPDAVRDRLDLDLDDRSEVRGRVILNGDGYYTVFACEDGQVSRRADFTPELEMFNDWCEIDLRPTEDGGMEYSTRDDYRGDPLGCAECPYGPWGDLERCWDYTGYGWVHELAWDEDGRLTHSAADSRFFHISHHGITWDYEYDDTGRVFHTTRDSTDYSYKTYNQQSVETLLWQRCSSGIRKVQTERHSCS